jgi:hypothetical protein
VCEGGRESERKGKERERKKEEKERERKKERDSPTGFGLDVYWEL